MAEQWTQKELNELKSMHAKGLTRYQIADTLNKTEGQVAGKIFRAGLRRSEPDNQSGPRVLELQAKLRESYRANSKLKMKRHDMRQMMTTAVEENIHLLADQLEPIPSPVIRVASGTPEVAVVMYSDLQLGKRTPDYNSDVGAERSAFYADRVVRLTQIQRSDHPVDEVHVWLLGDIVEGELIFPGQEWTLDSGLYSQAIVNGPKIVKQFLDKMLANFKHVKVSAVIGNHGAIGGRAKANMHPESNADLFLYEIVRMMYRQAEEKRIEFDIPITEGGEYGPWFAIDKIGNFSSMLFHGDQIRGSNSFPWYGFHKKVVGWHVLGSFPEFPMDAFTHAACGHWHVIHDMEFNGIEVRVNGTFESYNTYAQMQLASMGMPKQRLLFVSPKRGHVTNEYKVRLW